MLAIHRHFYLSVALRRSIKEATHAEMLRREGQRSAIGKGERVNIHAQAILAGSLESDTVGHTVYEVTTLGEELQLEVLRFFGLGAFNAASLVYIHLWIGVVALLLRGFVYGEHSGEATVGIEVEHGAGVGPHLIVAAGVAQHATLGVGLIDRSVYQRQRAVAAAIDHLQLLLAQHHACRREQLHVEHLAIGHGALGGLHYRSAEPDGLTLEVGGIVKVQVHLFLWAQAIEVVDVGTLHKNSL